MKKLIALSCLLFAGVSLKAQTQLPNKISAADKLYGLSKFWQEANYNFVYMSNVNKAAWDSTYKAMLISVPKTQNDYEYYRELQRLCALLHDGHTRIEFPDGITQAFTMFGDYRIFLENVDGKAIVTRTNLSKSKEIPSGSEIVEVNGKPTETYIAEYVTPYISTSSPHILKDEGITKLFAGLEGDTYAVKIKKPDGRIIALNLTHKSTAEKEVFPAFEPLHPILEFEWKNKDVAYLALNSFDDRVIDSLFHNKLPELYKAKGLIIDLRLNTGGSSVIARNILQYLTKDSVLYSAKSRSRVSIAANKAWGAYTKAKDTAGVPWAAERLLTYEGKMYHNFNYNVAAVNVKGERIAIPTVILIGHNTASASEDFLISADNQKNMYKIGDNTYGSTGQPLIFALPGGGQGWVCTKQDTYPDGRTFVGSGIVPDLKVIPTFKDYMNKKDKVMDAALIYLKDKLK